MSDRKYTLLIIPEGSHRVRRFSVGRRLLFTVLGCTAVTLLLGAGLLIDYVRTGVDRGELRRLRVQNQEQQKDLREILNRFEDLRKEMVILAQNDAKMRSMAQLEKSEGPRNIMVGVGGPAETVSGTSEMAELQQQIDELRQSVDLRRESHEEIRGFLTDQRSMLAAKPKGWPSRGWLTSAFGTRQSPFTSSQVMHEGIDIAARIGTPVYATADGIVSQAGYTDGYGKLIVVDHSYGYKTYYAHNSKLMVKIGQKIRRGDLIAAVGNTGSSTGSHLHYEVRLNGIPLNPKKFI